METAPVPSTRKQPPTVPPVVINENIMLLLDAFDLDAALAKVTVFRGAVYSGALAVQDEQANAQRARQRAAFLEKLHTTINRL